MTKVSIDAGACGFITVAEVRKKDKRIFSLTLTSGCEMVEKLGEALPELTTTDALRGMRDNPVFVKGGACLRHAACPVLCGILKALEVEAGLNVKKDPAIHFITEEENHE